MVPTYYVFFSLSAILVGGIVYRDFDNMTVLSVAMFAVGVLSCMLGVLLINSGRESGDDFDAVAGTETQALIEKDTPDSGCTAFGSPPRAFCVPSDSESGLLALTPPVVRRKSVSSFTLSPSVVVRPPRRASRSASTSGATSPSRTTSVSPGNLRRDTSPRKSLTC